MDIDYESLTGIDVSDDDQRNVNLFLSHGVLIYYAILDSTLRFVWWKIDYRVAGEGFGIRSFECRKCLGTVGWLGGIARMCNIIYVYLRLRLVC